MSSLKIEVMKQAGRELARVRDQLQSFSTVGKSFAQIEDLAQDLIAKAGMKPSFSTVAGYSWATCVMKNDALLHGIPHESEIINDGDLITIDVGILHRGFHVDTSVSFQVGKKSSKVQKFLDKGQEILDQAIQQAKIGNSVWHVSRTMQRGLQKYGWGAVYQMVGHGIGEKLHMPPSIPCIAMKNDKSVFFHKDQTVAIEIMYSMANPTLVQDSDGWTYRTQDGSLSAMFEHTVLITSEGPQILT